LERLSDFALRRMDDFVNSCLKQQTDPSDNKPNIAQNGNTNGHFKNGVESSDTDSSSSSSESESESERDIVSEPRKKVES